MLREFILIAENSHSLKSLVAKIQKYFLAYTAVIFINFKKINLSMQVGLLITYVASSKNKLSIFHTMGRDTCWAPSQLAN